MTTSPAPASAPVRPAASAPASAAAGAAASGGPGSGAEPAALQVELTAGPAAEELLASPDFARAWDDLYAAAPARTTFQSRTFANVWFDHYGDRFTPAVVTAVAPSGRLTGLLVLAVEPGGRRLHVAGAGQCEHQGWLALPECAEAFVPAALRALARRYPRGEIRFLRMPHGAATGWTARPEWRDLVVRQEQPWWFRDLASAPGAGSKKGNRRAMKKLGELGEPEFSEIRTPEQLAQFLDELIPHHDFRHEGAYGSAEFASDPRKRPFHEALFRAGFLRAFVLRVGGKFAAGAMAFADGDVVRQGPHAYVAELSRFFVSKHLVHAQCEQFAAEGARSYDLSPGSGYKERYGTRCETSVSLHVRFSAFGAARARLAVRRDAWARVVAARFGKTPEEVRELAAKVRERGLAGIVRGLAGRLRNQLGIGAVNWVQIYALDAGAARRVGRPGRFRVNSVEDLRLYETDGACRSRESFLRSALDRLADGHDSYTLVLDGRLVCQGWSAPGGVKSRISEVGASIHVPDGVRVLYDFWTHPGYRRRGLYEEVLRQCLLAVSERDDCRDAWIGVSDVNAASTAAIRKLGWRPIFAVPRRPAMEGGPEAARAARSLHPATKGLPGIVQRMKRAAYHAARGAGLFALARRITARDLRILCYHGFALDGEHAFAPRLFMRSETFDRRLDQLARGGWKVIPLDDAVARLSRGERLDDVVVLTIDDGAASVALRAAGPITRRALPATLYVTTYYVMRPRPVFQPALAYLLWKTDRTEMDLTKIGPFQRGTLRLDQPSEVAAFGSTIMDFTRQHTDEPARQELGRRIAQRLGLDWAEMVSSRRCSLLTTAELRDLAANGVDLQLHTHRHRLPVVREETLREIEDNRVWMRKIVPGGFRHFCYPSGDWDPAHIPWLREAGIVSATTCDAGLNPPGSDPLALRRILDGECVSEIEFEAEMSGFADLARRVLRRLRGRRDPRDR